MERTLPKKYENTRQYQIPLLSIQTIVTKDFSKGKYPAVDFGMPVADFQQSLFCPVSTSSTHASVKAPYVKLSEHVLSDQRTATGPFRDR